jgi:hypothetical protein
MEFQLQYQMLEEDDPRLIELYQGITKMHKMK